MDIESFWVFGLLAGALVCGILGMVVASGKGNGGMGFVLGLLLGPLGILIAVLLPRKDVPSASALRAKKKLQNFAARRGDPVEEWERNQRR
jgi:hypothetical protein